MNRMPFQWLPPMILAASILGCGGLVGSGPSQPPPASVSVSIAPGTAVLLLGTVQTFTAVVSNSTDTSVTWTVNGIPGGNATIGTISASGVYTAPADLPSSTSVTIQATSAADRSKNATASIRISSDISVSVTPQTMPMELGTTRPFTASVNSAGNPDRAIVWVISGNGCIAAACGFVDTGGNYTAPQILTAPPGISLTAISVADPGKSGVGAITITSSFTLSLTGAATVTAGTVANYTATLMPVTNSNPSRAVTWSISGAGCNGASCGAISASGVYTAPNIPPSPSTVQITATPAADISKAISVPVTIVSSISVSVSPGSATVPLSGAQALHATVTGAQDETVTWDVAGVVGGNSTVGTILNSQTDPDNTVYTAPQNSPQGGAVSVRARSNSNPNISASITITFTTAINVTLSPASATRAINHRQSFTAQVNNSSSQIVLWKVNGVSGGNTATGLLCAAGSNPCQSISSTNGGSVDYIAPSGLPSPNPVTLTATSQADTTKSGTAGVTILPHVAVSILPGNSTIANGGQLRFTATILGTDNQQVTWTASGVGCGASGACGSIDSTGLYTAPLATPLPNSISITAISAEDTSQSSTITVTISGGPSISTLAPSSAYAGAAGGFTLLVTGSNFSASSPGPSSAILVGGTARVTACASTTQCNTSLTQSDLQTPGNISVRLQNPDGSLSNTQNFVVLAPGASPAAIPLTPGAPVSSGNDIVVVDLSTNGGSGASGNVSLNVAAIGLYSVATSTCTLAGSPVALVRPASGSVSEDLCLFSVSGLDASFSYTISGPAAPDITITTREPLGLGILHLSFQVPSSAAPGPRTLFIENPNKDKAAGTGAIEVR